MTGWFEVWVYDDDYSFDACGPYKSFPTKQEAEDCAQYLRELGYNFIDIEEEG